MPAPYRFSWIDEPWLAAMANPQGIEDLEWLRSKGLQVLLSLTEDPVRRDWTNEAGLLVVHIPIQDMEPPTVEQFDRCISTIDRAIANKLGVTVHCQAGLGRTGTVLAAYFVHQGKSATEAINEIRELRPGSIETTEQARAVTEYAKRKGGMV